MIKTVLIVCFLGLAVAAPTPEEILNYDAVDHSHSQAGEAGTAVKGSYSYTDADGKTYTINYVADDNGYRAEGAHLPVAPEVPEVPAVAAPAVVDEPAAPAVVAAAPVPLTAPYFYPGAFPYYAYGTPFGYTYGYGVHMGYPYYRFY